MSTFIKFSPETQPKTKLYDGQRYELIRTEAYTRVYGSDTTLAAPFVFDAFFPDPHQEMEARVGRSYPPSAVGTSNAVNPERGAIIVRGKQLGAAS